MIKLEDTVESWKSFLQEIGFKKDVPCKTQDVTFSYINETLNEIEANLKPMFQRDLVWKKEQKVLLIESIFKGLKPNLNIIFGKIKDENTGWQLIDGQQRLNAILEFINNEFPVFVDKDGKGIFFSDLPPIGKRHLNSKAGIKFHYYFFENKNDVIDYYITFNSGGVPHTEEELQKARDLKTF